MSTESRVQMAAETVIQKHIPHISDVTLNALVKDLTSMEGTLWQTIAGWGETNAWERANEAMEKLMTQGQAARKFCLFVNDYIISDRDDVTPAMKEAWQEWRKVLIENGDV